MHKLTAVAIENREKIQPYAQIDNVGCRKIGKKYSHMHKLTAVAVENREKYSHMHQKTHP